MQERCCHRMQGWQTIAAISDVYMLLQGTDY